MKDKEVAAREEQIVSIGNSQLVFAEYSIPKAEATGKEILLAYGVEDFDKHLVFQWFHGGTTVRLDVEDNAKPDDGGQPLRFLVFEGSKTFEFVLDGDQFEWGANRITGRVLKLLAGLDPAMYGVWRENEKGEDDEIEDGDWSRLDGGTPVSYFTGRQETTEGGNPV